MTEPPAVSDAGTTPETRPSRAEPAAGVLIVGYGNEMCGDDVVGLLATSRMSGDARFGGATILAVRQLTPELADDMRGAGLVILVDAEADRVPATIAIRHLAGRRAPSGVEGHGADGARAAGASTSHHVDPSALAALARELWGAEPEVVVVSVGAIALELGDDPTPAVVAAVPRVVDEVALIVERFRHA